MNDKYKKRQKLIEVKWKKLEKMFDTPSASSLNRKKKKERAIEKEKEIENMKEDEDVPDEDVPGEDDGLDIEQDEDEDENVEEEYISDGGDE